jgi:hypothetical protein
MTTLDKTLALARLAIERKYKYNPYRLPKVLARRAT